MNWWVGSIGACAQQKNDRFSSAPSALRLLPLIVLLDVTGCGAPELVSLIPRGCVDRQNKTNNVSHQPNGLHSSSFTLNVEHILVTI